MDLNVENRTMAGRRITIAAALVLVAARTPAADAQLVTNGGFETVDPSVCADPAGFHRLDAGSALLPGWTIPSGSIDVMCTYWQHAQGSRSIDLNGLEPGRITQVVTLLPGALYQLSFAMAGGPEPTNNNGPKTMDVSVGSGFGESFSFDVAGHTTTSMGWTTHTRTFTVNAASNLLSFQSTTPGTFSGPGLDAVSIVQIAAPPTLAPEPATVALVACGLGALAAVARRRPG
jgi:choice-of-anchor C domain-containing protein